MKPIRIGQGTDHTVTIGHSYADLPSATEVEIFIDTPSQIVKTLGEGVSGVTAVSFVLTVPAEDTTSVKAGEYKIQARITTAGGSRLFGRINPDKVRILDTVFTDAE